MCQCYVCDVFEQLTCVPDMWSITYSPLLLGYFDIIVLLLLSLSLSYVPITITTILLYYYFTILLL